MYAEYTPALKIDHFIKQTDERDLVRLSTAGSVDDGKSTLIGRLLYDAKGVYEDQIASIRSAPINRSSGDFDLALLTDGLRAEREQGITIDVAYRYFATPKRKFIIADTPGHEQYTRNMATGASTANLAIILVDARNGIVKQSRRHAFIASMLGIQHIVVAVNKMDLVGYSASVFEGIRRDFSDFASSLQASDLHFIPISALNGDNVVEKSERMPWFEGASLLHYLETVHIASDRNLTEFRFPVQFVVRPDLQFRGYAGQIASGIVKPGDPVMVLPSRRTSRVKSISTYDGELEHAFPPMSVTICLEDELDVSRGDMLVPPSHPPHISRQIDARMVWMQEDPLEIGRNYFLRHTTQLVTASVRTVRYRINLSTLEKEGSPTLQMNDMGAVEVETQTPLFCDPYRRNRATGSFILVDPMTNTTVAAGMITGREAGPGVTAGLVSRAVFAEGERVTARERQARLGHPAMTLWMEVTADVAYRVERRLFDAGCLVQTIPASEGLNCLPEIACALNDAGVIVILAEQDATVRKTVCDRVGQDRFLTIGPFLSQEGADEIVARISLAIEQAGLVRL